MTGLGLDRRSLLQSASLFVAYSMAISPTAASAMTEKSGPPAARVEPVTDDYFGTKIVDPYRWMEDPKDRDWIPFLTGQNRYARSVLDTLPMRTKLLKRIESLSGDLAVTRRVVPAGDLLFYEQRPAGSENYKLFVREGSGAPRLLIDPTAMKMGDAHVSLDWWEPSFDGKYVAYGLSPAGSEASVLHVMAVATGEVLPERIEKADGADPAWLPDGSGFFYLQFTGARGTPEFYLDSHTRLHKLRTDPANDPIVLKRGLVADIPVETNQFPQIVTTPGSVTALALVSDVRPERAMWSAPLADLLAGRAEWQRVCGFDDLVSSFALLGDDLYLLANRDAIRGRVLRMSASSPDLVKAAEVVAQGPTVIEALDGARDGVYVTIMDGGIEHLGKIRRDGSFTKIRLPFDAALGVFAAPDRDGAYVNLAGWLNPPAIWQVDRDGQVHETDLAPRPTIDLSPYDARRGFAAAKDGVGIPYTIIARRGVERNGANPTLVTAYGAYEISLTPSFNPRLLAFLDAGGVFVVANVRGGGEYGRPWHHAAMKETKPNTWRDLIAVCEELIADRITSARHLAIMGTSAGGITVGRAMTERPDLFAAVISNVGWSNPLRYVAEQNSFGEIPEWGSVEDEKGFRGLLQMDSYQAVRDGVAYPAVLCVTGVTDPRVAPFHVAKFAARLQAATSSKNPVLLRVDFDAGHGIGSTRSQTDQLYADIYAFVLWRTGVP